MDAPAILMYGHGEVLKAMDGLAESLWEQGGVCGVWSVKDIIAHLASYEQMLIDVLKSVNGEIETAILSEMFRLGPLDFNDVLVERYRPKTAAEIWADYNAAYDEVAVLVKGFSPERFRELGTIPWYGNSYSLDDLAVYQYYGHKREHVAQINVYRDTLK